MGPVPLNWDLIESWQRLMGIELEPKEVIALRHLSFAFVDQQSKSKDPKCPPPWVDPEQINRDRVSDKVSDTFRAISERRKKQRGRSR